jgi:hypothetical protein
VTKWLRHRLTLYWNNAMIAARKGAAIMSAIEQAAQEGFIILL